MNSAKKGCWAKLYGGRRGQIDRALCAAAERAIAVEEQAALHRRQFEELQNERRVELALLTGIGTRDK